MTGLNPNAQPYYNERGWHHQQQHSFQHSMHHHQQEHHYHRGYHYHHHHHHHHHYHRREQQHHHQACRPASHQQQQQQFSAHHGQHLDQQQQHSTQHELPQQLGHAGDPVVQQQLAVSPRPDASATTTTTNNSITAITTNNNNSEHSTASSNNSAVAAAALATNSNSTHSADFTAKEEKRANEELVEYRNTVHRKPSSEVTAASGSVVASQLIVKLCIATLHVVKTIAGGTMYWDYAVSRGRPLPEEIAAEFRGWVRAGLDVGIPMCAGGHFIVVVWRHARSTLEVFDSSPPNDRRDAGLDLLVKELVLALQVDNVKGKWVEVRPTKKQAVGSNACPLHAASNIVRVVLGACAARPCHFSDVLLECDDVSTALVKAKEQHPNDVVRQAKFVHESLCERLLELVRISSSNTTAAAAATAVVSTPAPRSQQQHQGRVSGGSQRHPVSTAAAPDVVAATTTASAANRDTSKQAQHQQQQQQNRQQQTQQQTPQQQKRGAAILEHSRASDREARQRAGDVRKQLSQQQQLSAASPKQLKLQQAASLTSGTVVLTAAVMPPVVATIPPVVVQQPPPKPPQSPATEPRRQQEQREPKPGHKGAALSELQQRGTTTTTAAAPVGGVAAKSQQQQQPRVTGKEQAPGSLAVDALANSAAKKKQQDDAVKQQQQQQQQQQRVVASRRKQPEPKPEQHKGAAASAVGIVKREQGPPPPPPPPPPPQEKSYTCVRCSRDVAAVLFSRQQAAFFEDPVNYPGGGKCKPCTQEHCAELQDKAQSDAVVQRAVKVEEAAKRTLANIQFKQQHEHLCRCKSMLQSTVRVAPSLSAMPAEKMPSVRGSLDACAASLIPRQQPQELQEQMQAFLSGIIETCIALLGKNNNN